MLFTNESFNMQLALDFTNAKKNINIISAYVTYKACELLIESCKNKHVSKILVGRFTPYDFISGSSSLSALRFLIDNNVKVKALSNLHAKIYQIDTNIIYSGSANFTANGLSLISPGNLEASFRVPFDDRIGDFIQKIIMGSTELTIEMINKMEEFIANFELSKVHDIPLSWPSEVFNETSDLFVSDFPLAQPGKIALEYTLNPSLTFAQIEANKDNFVVAEKIFKQSKSYLWLKKQVKDNVTNRDLNFGQISRRLHDVLADDPGPYRQEVKNLQVNLYSYLKIYAADEIEIYVPGNRSEVIRVIN